MSERETETGMSERGRGKRNRRHSAQGPRGPTLAIYYIPSPLFFNSFTRVPIPATYYPFPKLFFNSLSHTPIPALYCIVLASFFNSLSHTPMNGTTSIPSLIPYSTKLFSFPFPFNSLLNNLFPFRTPLKLSINLFRPLLSFPCVFSDRNFMVLF